MREKKAPAKAFEPEDKVRLKPILGLRPGVYLAVIYSAILLAILFFVLVHPGIRNPGARVVFSSEPYGAALRINGVYAGTSPSHFFVPAGNHSMEIVMPGFETVRMENVIPRRIFASRLFPHRYRLSVTLTATDPIAALAISASEHVQWSFGGEPSVVWQIPRSLSEGVYRMGPAAVGGDVDEILAASARFTVTRAALRDLVRAKTLADAGGNSPSPLGLARSVSDITAFLADNPASALWLADLLPPASASVLIASSWYQRQLAGFAEIVAAESLAPNPATVAPHEVGLPMGQIRVGGLLFAGLGGGTLVQGEPFPHKVPIESFLISTTQVPPSVFADFLDANPKWGRDNLDALERQGLASADYLADFGILSPGGGWTGTGINTVSWFAAMAFCEWLTSMLPAELSGWEVRLPTEAEWEFAAKSARAWDNFNGIFVPNNGSWEWCADPYSPLPFFAAPPWAIDALGSPERPVRGGSWLNAAGITNVETRAFLPPTSASPFVSFRPVIAPRRMER
ncbi:MAG: SUMF1/EgtB/PvdO family nonheme iron enzyme [Treponema sp.]|nr:SUMF1/EgtB/PvdO family nonheme iron enzyme [Treponema sp.]